MKDRLKAAIKETLLQSTGLEPSDLPAFTVEVPKEKGHGDFATNVALVCAKKLKTAPRKLAEKLLESLSGLDFIERVEVAGPGFINFFLAEHLGIIPREGLLEIVLQIENDVSIGFIFPDRQFAFHFHEHLLNFVPAFA